MHKRNHFAILSLLIFAACKSSPNLNGTWETGGCIEDEQGNCEIAWFKEYTFKGENYFMTGYPPIEEEGRIEYLETAGNTFKVKLISENYDPSDYVLEIMKFDEDSIRINGEVYYRKD